MEHLEETQNAVIEWPESLPFPERCGEPVELPPGTVFIVEQITRHSHGANYVALKIYLPVP